MRSVIAKNSALKIKNMIAALKKVKIKNKTEWTGFETKTTKKLDKIRVKPIIYDDVHIIVVNPYEQEHQIATVSKVINA